MRKAIVPLLLLLIAVFQTKAQSKSFDQPVQLKSCNIKITANAFIATTFIELEFYNPQQQEVEGYYSFQLDKGQVVTGFQLELNGVYREGSIEERWKANRAYSTIVGKRVDPAILQMDYQDHYSLRIYPFAARSSRKVIITISQLMEEDSLKLKYNLPLAFTNATESFNLAIKVDDASMMNPVFNCSFLQGQLFTTKDNLAYFNYSAKQITLNKPISFYLNLQKGQSFLCSSREGENTNFLYRFIPEPARYYDNRFTSITVFWDVSFSARSRNTVKELEFLERYMNEYSITEIDFILFNQTIKERIHCSTGKNEFYKVKQRLANYEYNGYTSLDNLDFAAVESGAILLFSDGASSLNNLLPKQGTVQVNCITSGNGSNIQNLQRITGETGGAVLNLNELSFNDALPRIARAENFLFKINSANTVNINESLPIRLGNPILLTGQMNGTGKMNLMFGNNLSINAVQLVDLKGVNCDSSVFQQVLMLRKYQHLSKGYSWENLIAFGIENRIVTTSTSFLVLERIEDYIKYNIAPPKELEAKCAELNYVYHSAYKYKLQEQRKITEQENLASVVYMYNRRIKWWDVNAAPIDLTSAVRASNTSIVNSNHTEEAVKSTAVAAANAQQISPEILNQGQGDLAEVVVTSAFSIRGARSISCSVSNVSNDQILNGTTNLNQALAGKVAGLQIVAQQNSLNNFWESSLRIRGASTPPAYVLDGNIVDNVSMINLNDIDNITVIKGVQAAALYGSAAANGAIVITSKRPRNTYYNNWSEFKYSSLEDVSYMEEMRDVAASAWTNVYQSLQTNHSQDVGFYFDMADFFFEKKMPKEALEILNNGIELCNGNVAGIKAAAYILDSWKEYDEAIEIYESILKQSPADIATLRDMGLSLLQKADYKRSVDVYYKIITMDNQSYNHNIFKDLALSEMNAAIALSKDSINYSYINQELIKPLPIDLRISWQSNYHALSGLQIIEPGNETCSYSNPSSKNGGLMAYYNSYYYGVGDEYCIKTAPKGKYRIKLNSYGYYYDSKQAPILMRMVAFRNFQSAKQTIEVKNYIMNNLYGVVELDPIKL